MTIKAELLSLRDEDGIVHVREVVTWAKANPGSSLHQALEWDDATAADAWRLEQVRGMIRIYVTSGPPTERLVSLSIDRAGAGGYRTLSDVGARPDLRDILLQDALDELERVQAKYDRVRELEGVWKAAAEARVGPGRGRKKAVQAPQPAAA